MDINDPFIQKVLLGDWKKIRYREVENFADRNPHEIELKKGKGDKIKVRVIGLPRTEPLIPVLKIERIHGSSEKYVDKQYIKRLVDDLVRAGLIKEEDIK